jgi:Tfp pilus assembly protein PilN
VGRDDLLVGLVRKELLDSYETLFAEAGILMGAVTFSSAVIHAAIRIWSAASASFFCFSTRLTDARGDHTAERERIEVYGESESRAVFSAEFSVAPERAMALSRAELRIGHDHPAKPLSEILPPALHGKTPPSALAYAAAITGAVGRRAKFANLLPAERRASHNRLQYLIPGFLTVLLALALLAVFVVFPALEQKRYREELDRAVRQLEPAVLRTQTLQKKTAADRLRTTALDEFRRRTQADLDVLNELTRLLPPPIWTSAVEIYPDSVVISGEADQAAPLLKVLDASPLFQNSEFALGVAHNGQAEQFRIKTLRRGRTGRTTP